MSTGGRELGSVAGDRATPALPGSWGVGAINSSFGKEKSIQVEC